MIGADGTARTVGWSELSGVTWSRKGLILVHRSGSATQLPARWLGIGGADLAARLLEWRRRALLGVLRPPPR